MKGFSGKPTASRARPGRSTWGKSKCSASHWRSVFAKAKRQEIGFNADALDVLHAVMDEIERLLHPEGSSSAKPGDLIRRLEALSIGPPGAEQPAQPGVEEAPVRSGAEKIGAEESVRVPAEQLDHLFLQVEELVPSTMAAAYRSAELRELARDMSLWRREWAKAQPVAHSLRRSLDGEGGVLQLRATEARTLLEFLGWNDEFARGAESRLKSLSRAAERDRRSMGTKLDSLLRDTKMLLLRPFSSLTETFPKLVRDLCRQQGKEASLSVSGAGVDIDRRILQEIKDPLIHMVRNCVDHGIENPEGRSRANKVPRGTVTIAINQKSASQVEIAISDDGAGIDPQKVRNAAVKSGLITEESAQAIGDTDILAFIFQSGISTSPIVTDISGRGLGMAIVREKVERLGGDITLDTHLGAGTTFRLLLPLTMSTIRGLLVRAGEQSFIIPVTFVEEVASAKGDSIQSVENRSTVALRGKTVSFVRLHEVLGLPTNGAGDKGSENMSLVVLAVSEKRIAFQVDEIVGEQEVLVKSLGPQLVRLRNLGGAALLGTGKLVPILNVADLMKSAVKTASLPREIEASTAPPRRSILVVDDSITARTLLKSILEAEGYLVRTAVDGAEAFATLRETVFDLVVSDVDMPRLNGFDLTARIRAGKDLGRSPCNSCDCARIEGGPGKRDRCRSQCVCCKEQLRAKQPSGNRAPIRLAAESGERVKSTTRVLIVDDSGVYREFLSHLLGSDPQIEIAGAVRDGAAAFEAVPALHPDVITMDVNMPGMNGYDVTRKIMESHPTPIIVVSGTEDAGDVEMSFRALESGALAVYPKPRGGMTPEAVSQSQELIMLVKLMAEVKVVRRWSRRGPPAAAPDSFAAAGTAASPPQSRQASRSTRAGFNAVFIGASTGGPLPIRTILSALPPDFPSAVLIVQHIAAGFASGFAEWLAGASRLAVHIAVDGEIVAPGNVYVAPDRAHMAVRDGPRIRLDQDQPENGLRPSVSHLFRSAAIVYGRRAIGVLLSGMGRDGAEELKELRDIGAVTFAQDRESCVVFGMPGEAVRLGGASYTMPPEAISAAIVSLVETGDLGRGTVS